MTYIAFLNIHMKKRLLFAICLGFSLLTFSSFDNSVKTNTKKKPKNVILLIGDGMGLSQVSYAIVNANERMNFERFKQLGMSKTAASNHKITDSAAGATALSTGKKTYNGAIAVDDNKQALPTILELAEKKGMATGMIATCAITHATPASFIAHRESRELYEDIALDFLNTEIDLFIGGGLDHFSKRKDNKDLVQALKDREYNVITNVNDLYSYNSPKKLAALIAPKHLTTMTDGRGNYLEKATELGINILSKDPDGFFLMVEGSQIDWGGHANDAEYVRTEVMDFDRAIKVALDFAERDGNTLVIVTADHETGGLALSGNEEDKTQNKIEAKFTTKNHTGVMVPVYSYGPGSEKLEGIFENTFIFNVMKESLRIK
jgi:alkaline phosphatase